MMRSSNKPKRVGHLRVSRRLASSFLTLKRRNRGIKKRTKSKSTELFIFFDEKAFKVAADKYGDMVAVTSSRNNQGQRPIAILSDGTELYMIRDRNTSRVSTSKFDVSGISTSSRTNHSQDQIEQPKNVTDDIACHGEEATSNQVERMQNVPASPTPPKTSQNEDHNTVGQILNKLKNIEPNIQFNLWKQMIDNHSFDLHQLKSLRTAIDDRIKLDIISCVPYEIALYIMSFLNPNELCQAAQVCRSWRTVCEDNRLWREKCQEEGLLDDEQTLEVLFKSRISSSHNTQEKFAKECLSKVPRSEWKLAYSKHIDILRNWKTRRFDFSDPLIIRTPNRRLADQPQQPSVTTRSVARRSGIIAGMVGPQRSRRITRQSNNSNENISMNNEGSSLDNYNGNESNTGFSEIYNSNLMQLRCHEDCVITCLQFNPRTNIIVSGSDDQTLKVWSSETGRCLTTLQGHTGGVWSSQLSPDDIVVSGSTDRTLKVWKAHTGELMHTLSGHTSTVRCLALDGDKVVSGSRDTTLRLWDIKEGVCIHVFGGHFGAVRCVEYKNDIIVSGAYDHLVMVWDAKTGACCHELECHYSRIYSLQFDGKTIASGSLDSTICIWDAETGKLRHHLEGHQSLTSKMQLKGNLLVSANADSFCKVWNIKTGECLQTLGGENKHTSAITSVYFNKRHVVTSSDDGTVKLWDIKTGNFIRNLVLLPTASKGGVVWRIRASYTKLICAVGSRAQIEDTHLLVLDFNG